MRNYRNVTRTSNSTPDPRWGGACPLPPRHFMPRFMAFGLSSSRAPFFFLYNLTTAGSCGSLG